jgi:hypothetical protein
MYICIHMYTVYDICMYHRVMYLCNYTCISKYDKFVTGKAFFRTVHFSQLFGVWSVCWSLLIFAPADNGLIPISLAHEAGRWFLHRWTSHSCHAFCKLFARTSVRYDTWWTISDELVAYEVSGGRNTSIWELSGARWVHGDCVQCSDKAALGKAKVHTRQVWPRDHAEKSGSVGV